MPALPPLWRRPCMRLQEASLRSGTLSVQSVTNVLPQLPLVLLQLSPSPNAVCSVRSSRHVGEKLDVVHLNILTIILLGLKKFFKPHLCPSLYTVILI